MNISRSCADPHGRAFTVLYPQGALDWSSYESLIAQAQAARAQGATRLVVDLSAVDRVSIAGLVALHLVARLAAGLPLPPAEAGWAAIHALTDAEPPSERLAVLRPPPALAEQLASPPLSRFLVVYPELATASAA